MLAPWFNIHSRRPLNWLLGRGCDVVFVDRKDPYPEGRERYRFKTYPRSGIRYCRRLLGCRTGDRFVNWTMVPRLWLLWRRIKPDVVHLHWVDRRAYHCVKAGLRPLVLSVWGSDINQHFLTNANPDDRRIAGRALAGADLVLVDHPCMVEKCAILAGRSVRTKILHLGIDTKAFRPGYGAAANEWRRRLEVAADTKVLLSMRGWGPHNGHHIILEAFSRARRYFKTRVVLVFKTYNRISYPDSIAYELELRRRAEQLGIAQSVRWLEEVLFTKLPEIYAFADVIINYASMDTFPMTFLEAAACERPLISGRLPSYQGTFAERCFHMVDLGNVSALADAMVELINNPSPERARRLCEARRIVEREYNELSSADRLLSTYEELACL
ncbi:MAG: glycosyltransferase family 4 protein [Candidatus Binatia bacterium]